MPTATATPLETLRSDLQSGLTAAYPELISRLTWSREHLVAHPGTSTTCPGSSAGSSAR